MQIHTKHGIKGQFAVQVLDVNGNVKETRPLTDNLVLDNMFRHLCKQDITHNTGYKAKTGDTDSFQLILGTGSGTITPQDTALLSKNSYSYQSYQTYNYQFSQEKNKLKTRLTLNYAWVNTGKQGVILTELGLGFADSGKYLLVTHAKFKGINDEALSITVLPYETLKVTYILTMATDTTPVRKKVAITFKDGEAVTTKDYNTVLSVYGCPKYFHNAAFVPTPSTYSLRCFFGTLQASQNIENAVITDSNRWNFSFPSGFSGQSSSAYVYFSSLAAQAAGITGNSKESLAAWSLPVPDGTFAIKSVVAIGTVQDFNVGRGLCAVSFNMGDFSQNNHSLVLAMLDDEGNGIKKNTTQRIQFTLTTEFTRSE